MRWRDLESECACVSGLYTTRALHVQFQFPVQACAPPRTLNVAHERTCTCTGTTMAYILHRNWVHVNDFMFERHMEICTYTCTCTYISHN